MPGLKGEKKEKKKICPTRGFDLITPVFHCTQARQLINGYESITLDCDFRFDIIYA